MNRAAQTPNDSDLAFHRCLVEHGWDAKVEPDGGVSVHIPHEQRERYDADSDACKAKLGIVMTAGPMAQQRAEAFTDALFKEYECVVAAGYQPSEPPSRQAIIEGLVRDGRPIWSPVSDALKAANNGNFTKVRDAVDPCLRFGNEVK